MAAPAKLFCAVDVAGRKAAIDLTRRIAAEVDGIKLGLEFFCAHGPEGVRAVLDGFALPLFLDLKLHDIPNTVASAVRAAGVVSPAFLTLHAAGGSAMLRAAAAAADEVGAATGHRPKLLAVTILTSLDADDLAAVGQHPDVAGQVARLARLAAAAGIDGVVCAPSDLATLRSQLGNDVFLATPGIRPAGSGRDDQKRVLSPGDAVAAGADMLVVGRPITQAADPAAAARDIRSAMIPA